MKMFHKDDGAWKKSDVLSYFKSMAIEFLSLVIQLFSNSQNESAGDVN